MMRSSVVLPLPDGPRIETNEPAVHHEIEPAQHLLGPKRLDETRDVEFAHVTTLGTGAARARPGSRSKNRPSRYAGTAAMRMMTKAKGAAWP